MNELKNILILILLATLFIGCNNKAIQPLQNIVIDAGPFIVTTPSDFKLVKESGIDSYVGKITNGKVEFGFDYGWYSNRGPLTYYDYADKYLFKLHKDEIVSTCKISDSIYQIVKSNPIILDAKRNPNFPEETDKEISITISVGTGTCTIYTFNLINDISQNYETYEISETINNDIRRKEYSTKSGKDKKAGVYIENLAEKRDEKYGHNKLSFTTNDFKENNSNLILEILKSVKLNTTGNKR